MSEAVNFDGTRIWTINQQGAVDRLEINAKRNEIVLNGSSIEINISQTATASIDTMEQISSVRSGTVWYAMGTGSKYHVQLERTVRSATETLLYVVIYSIMGPIGTGLGIAQAIIDVAISYNSASTALFVARRIYRDYHYLQYKYEDNYYFDRNDTDWAYYNETIVLSAN